MKLKQVFGSIAAAAMLSLFVPAIAAPQNHQAFSALQGIDAQALSVEEMQAITGELNALDIAAALTAKAAELGAFPRLQAAVLKLAAFYTTNADAINAAFMKLGVYTAPK